MSYSPLTGALLQAHKPNVKSKTTAAVATINFFFIKAPLINGMYIITLNPLHFNMQNSRFKQNIRNSISFKQPRGARFNISEKVKKTAVKGTTFEKIAKMDPLT